MDLFLNFLVQEYLQEKAALKPWLEEIDGAGQKGEMKSNMQRKGNMYVSE